jgi:tellurium resistance protein TerD
MANLLPPHIQELSAGLGWQPSNQAVEPDIDLSVFLLGDEGKLPETDFFVFYNNLQSPDAAVSHLGDAPVASGNHNDLEQLHIKLPLLDKRISSLLLVVTVHEAEKYAHHFATSPNAYIRICNAGDGAELLRYDLSTDFANESAITVARLQRTEAGWTFEPLGEVKEGGLAAFVALYN